jgi:F-type H+-transporting ATPase subunit epsilon
MQLLNLKIITPEKVILDEEVSQVTLPTVSGEITVLPGHIPLVTLLGKGDIVGIKDGESIPLAIVGGFVRVAGDEVAIMADFAEHVSALTNEEIEKAKARAFELQRQFDNNEIVDFERYEAELTRSLTRVSVGDKWKVRKYRK